MHLFMKLICAYISIYNIFFCLNKKDMYDNKNDKIILMYYYEINNIF